MVENKSLGMKIFRVVNTLLMLLMGAICFLPMWHVLMASISDPILLQQNHSLLLWPLGPATEKGYLLVSMNPNILSSYANTLFYVVVGTLLSVFGTLTIGYVLSRRSFRYRNVLMVMITITMLFKAGMVPLFLVVKSLKLLDTRWAVLLPSLLSVFNITIMRTAIEQLPESLMESAKIDGAGDVTILTRIVFPLVKTTFAVIVLFYAVSKWNEWFNAMLFLQNRKLFPLQLVLREILIINSDANAAGAEVAGGLDNYKELTKYATIIVATVPILCIYPFAQKYFVSGVMIGAVKG